MADKLLICVSAQQASVAHWRAGRIADCRVFGNDDPGLAAFEELLAQFSNIPVYLMVDTVEEDYRFEMLPHAFGSDRADMVSRKLKQYYRNTPYFGAWLQGRDSGKRRDDRYLFSALTNPNLVNVWLQPIMARGLPVGGIYLLPLVSTALLDKMHVSAPDLLVIAQHSGGLRITFFRDGKFLLSRLTRGDAARGENRAALISSEISNTLLYLHALRTTILDEHLTVLLLDRDDGLIEIAQHIARENPSFECVRLGSHELVTQLGIARTSIAISPDVIYLHLLGLRPPESNLIPANIAAGYRRYQARRAIYAMAGAVMLTGAVWSAMDFYQMANADGETAEAARRTALHQAQYRDITRQFPAAPTSADNLKSAVEIAQRLTEITRTPEHMMSVVSKELDKSPTIALTRFAWRFGPTEIDGSASPATAAAETTPRPAGVAPPRKQSGLVEGEIRPFRGDYRAAIETIRAFAEQLERDPAVEKVRVLKLPLNINPALALSGNTLDSREQTGKADFRLLLVLKPNQ